MPKITLLGAGSGFTQPLFTDILNIEGLDGGTISLIDIDEKRLEINVRLMKRIIGLMGKKKWKIEASTDRCKLLRGTDYLINTIEVSGVECVAYDYEIPQSYGIDQCVGDTIGPGGVMKALRTLPSFVDILKDVQRYCPNALIMNYTNPMSMMTLGAIRITEQPIVGLCHSVQDNSRSIAEILGISYEELEWKCGGINHMAWFTMLRWKGRDMIPHLRAAAEREDVMDIFPVRAELLRHLGYFATEGCGHFSEYVPYFRKRKDILKDLNMLDTSGFYARNWPVSRKAIDKGRHDMAEGKCVIPLSRSFEYASEIIEAHYFDRKKIIYASVKNDGLITNLPRTGVVEVATLVDRYGYSPLPFGNLPEQCAALCRSNMAVFELCVDGILSRDRDAVINAMMLDPLSAAVCSLEEIRRMAEKLFDAEKKYIPGWCTQPQKVFVSDMKFPAITKFVRKMKISKVQPHCPLEKQDKVPAAACLNFKMTDFENYFINIHPVLEKKGKCLAFFSSTIKCDETMKLVARLGYDGPVKVWIDGKNAFYDPSGTNPATKDKAKIPFTVTRGTHEIVIALDSNNGNAWGISLRFERVDISNKMGKKIKLPFFAS